MIEEMNATTTATTTTVATTCHDCGTPTDTTRGVVQMDGSLTFYLCERCDLACHAASVDMSLADWLANVPSWVATDLQNGMISQQEHDEMIDHYASIAA